MNALLSRKFVFVVGKGGVGKTTVAAALGLAAAKEGKRVLIAMVNAKERLSTLLGTAPIGTNIVEVTENLHAVNMTPEASLEEYGMLVLKVRALYSAVFENRLVRAFLRGTPGIEAWSMLGKAYFHAFGHGPESDGEYDLVIVDAPATGHGLDMLRVPEVIVNVAPPGLLRREAERALTAFRDKEKSAALLVTLAEDMPTTETIELHEAIGKMQIATPLLVVNQVLPLLFNGGAEQRLLALKGKLDEKHTMEGIVEASRVRARREHVQEESLERLDTLPLSRLNLPFLHASTFGRGQIEALSEAFR